MKKALLILLCLWTACCHADIIHEQQVLPSSPWGSWGVNIKDYGATGDGTTNDSAAIQAAITAALASSKVLYIPAGNYVCLGLTIEGSLTIYGYGTLKHAVSASPNSLLLCNDTDEGGEIVYIEGITFDGNGAARKAASEVWATTRADVYSTVASMQLKINNCVFTNMRDKAVRICGPLRLTNCRFQEGQPHDGTNATHYVYGIPYGADQPKGGHIIIQGNSFVGYDVTTKANYDLNPTGVFITFGTDDEGAQQYFESIVIEGNTFEGCGVNGGLSNVTAAIDTYSGAEKVVISNNVIRKHSFCGIKAQAVDKCTITGNVISEGYSDADSAVPWTCYGILVEEKPRVGATDERYDVIISNNVINYAMYVGIQAYCDNLVVSGNLLRDVGKDDLALGVGILTKGANHLIDGNLLIEFEQKGIQSLTPSSNVKISNNLLNNTTYEDATGIEYTAADKVTITNNHLQCNGGSAIRTIGLSDIVLIENNFIDAANYGIDIRETSGANTEVIVGKNNILNSATADRNDATTSGLAARVIGTLDNTGTPSVANGEYWLTGGTTAITDFDDGIEGQIITIIAEHSLTITDGTNIFISGSANWAMTATDTLTLICKADNKWYEVSRSDSGA